MDRVQSSMSELRSYEVTRQTIRYASLRSCTALHWLSLSDAYTVSVWNTQVRMFFSCQLADIDAPIYTYLSVSTTSMCVYTSRFVTTAEPTPVTTTNAIFSLATVMTHFLPHYKATSPWLVPRWSDWLLVHSRLNNSGSNLLRTQLAPEQLAQLPNSHHATLPNKWVLMGHLCLTKYSCQVPQV